MKTVTIGIGGPMPDLTIWHIVDTNAPADYDGFGTFAVTEYEGTRTVLIRTEHYNWQTMRYSSGNHWHKESVHEEAAVAQALWHRLQGRKE